ncbi:MAG: hypothetical protein AB8G99_04585 [Planctomycetaceae bacterium]
MIELRPIIEEVLRQQVVEGNGIHGLLHWGRVYDNGVRIAEEVGANLKVVQLFAFFHDSRRFNDSQDPGHGERGAKFAEMLRGEFFEVTDEEFQLLYIACRDHTDEQTADDLTVQACFDADRLDLFRVGIKPRPELLCTEVAKREAVRAWANQRADDMLVADVVAEIWEERYGV